MSATQPPTTPPLPTPSSSPGRITRVIEFCNELDPKFSSRLRGASPQAIDALQTAMNRKLSPTYREFLERMGEGTGGEELGQYEASPAFLLRERPSTLRTMPSNVELLAIPTGEVEADVFLVHGDGREAHVVWHEPLEYEHSKDFDPGRADPMAGDLAELLGLATLSRVALAQRHHVELGDAKRREGQLGKARELLEKAGAKPYFWSNPWTFAGSANGLYVVAKQAPTWPLSVGIAGSSASAVEALAETVAQSLGLAPSRTRS